jgi:hypothetical protein
MRRDDVGREYIRASAVLIPDELVAQLAVAPLILGAAR